MTKAQIPLSPPLLLSVSFAVSEKRLCRDWRLGRDSSAVLQVLCDLLQKVVLRESNSTYTQAARVKEVSDRACAVPDCCSCQCYPHTPGSVPKHPAPIFAINMCRSTQHQSLRCRYVNHRERDRDTERERERERDLFGLWFQTVSAAVGLELGHGPLLQGVGCKLGPPVDAS